jgi:hypothetical protein
VVATTWLLAAAAFLLGNSAIPLIISTVSLVAFSLSVALCWLKFGRDILPGRAFLAAGPFLANKLRLYTGIMRGRGPSHWVRTERGKSTDE